MSQQLRHLALAFVIAFGFMALAAGYWAVVEQTALLDRVDNPRRLLMERRFPRGTILDRNGNVLAETRGTPNALTRVYPYPALAPVLGYVSPFYGLTGVEATLDEVLHGDAGRDALGEAWDAIVGSRPGGRAVQLTLDLALQEAADRALAAGHEGREHTGAVVILNPVTGELLALASHPTFDPNTLEDNWDALIADERAPLLNRATSALYQPGGAMQPFVLAESLQTLVAELDNVFLLAGAPYRSGELSLGCRSDPRATALLLEEAVRFGCPQPFAALGERLGARRLEQLITDLRFTTAPQIGVPTLAAAAPDFATEMAALGAGQGSLTLTPLHIALATAALANRGQVPAPQLIRATQNAAGDWQPFTSNGYAVAAFAPDVAARVKEFMRNGHGAIAIAGKNDQRLAWFMGFAPYDSPNVVVTVLLEEGDLTAAQAIGEALLAAAAR
jgi:peptidoglycan glycosyltransferase